MAHDPVVHVIDDDPAVRDSIAFLLQCSSIDVRSYESGLAFLNQVQAASAGCIVTDVRMPGLSGIDLLAKLRERSITMPVIVITGHGDVPLAVQAMKLGAVDFIEKPFEEDQLLASVRFALAVGDSGAARDETLERARERMATLTTREMQTLEALVNGHPNKVIAYQLGISPRTVEVHRANVMAKMEVNSLPELVRLALLAGLESH